MSLFELLSLILENLGRRKGRVALTAIGVIIGTSAVVVLVSLAIGLQRNATEQLGGIGDLTRIEVMPNYGEMMAGPGPVVVEMARGGGGGGGGGGGQPTNQKLITDEALTELAALPGVVAVIPQDYAQTGGMITFEGLQNYPNMLGVGVDDLSQLGLSADAGTLVLERGTAIVGYYVPQSFFNPRLRPGQEPPPPPDLLGKQITITLIKWVQEGAEGREVHKNIQVQVVGIIAESRTEADYSIYMTIDEVTAINEWALGRRISRSREGYSKALVKVADVGQVLDVTDQINALGYQAYTPQSFVEGINNFFVILQVIFGGVGAIALLVAAIGIANTMAMAILERTREIGLLKAVGATNRDVLSIFLGEAAGIGFIGGIGGVILGWSGGQILNVLALGYLAGQAAQGGGPPPSVAVYTPIWLPVFALLFATLIGLISGLYPALRAATLIPVTALKYE